MSLQCPDTRYDQMVRERSPSQLYDFIISENIWVFFLKMYHFNLRRVFFFFLGNITPLPSPPSPWLSGFILPTMTLISRRSNHMKEGKEKKNPRPAGK